MTLVIAARKNGHVHFVSDSRVTFGDQGFCDIGIKIFSNPVKVMSAIDPFTNESTTDYEHNVGIAVIGGAINSYLIKDTIYEILQNVQHNSLNPRFSFEEVAKLVFKVYKRTSEELSFLRNNSLCSVLLGGYCSEMDTIRIFKFEPNMNEENIWSYNFSEFLSEDGVEFFGKGKERAIAINSIEQDLSPFEIMKMVIQDEDVPSVGGGIQYGGFHDKDFRILGIEDYSVNPDGSFKEHLYTLRGISLYKNDFNYKDCDLHINYKFLRAFQKDIEMIKRKDIEGLSDNFINDIFDGDPDAYWNID